MQNLRMQHKIAKNCKAFNWLKMVFWSCDRNKILELLTCFNQFRRLSIGV